jgi:uncharacterized membrane protein
MIAAVYAAVTLFLAPISFGPLQIRVAEALTVLPFLYPTAIFGLFVGCLIANIGGTMMGVSLGMPDIIFGSLATLLAAFLTSKCKKVWLAPLPPIVVNAVVIGAVLTFVTTPGSGLSTFPLFAGEVAVGQTLSCYVIGMPLLLFLKKKDILSTER